MLSEVVPCDCVHFMGWLSKGIVQVDLDVECLLFTALCCALLPARLHLSWYHPSHSQFRR